MCAALCWVHDAMCLHVCVAHQDKLDENTHVHEMDVDAANASVQTATNNAPLTHNVTPTPLHEPVCNLVALVPCRFAFLLCASSCNVVAKACPTHHKLCVQVEVFTTLSQLRVHCLLADSKQFKPKDALIIDLAVAVGMDRVLNRFFTHSQDRFKYECYDDSGQPAYELLVRVSTG